MSVTGVIVKVLIERCCMLMDFIMLGEGGAITT